MDNKKLEQLTELHDRLNEHYIQLLDSDLINKQSLIDSTLSAMRETRQKIMKELTA